MGADGGAEAPAKAFHIWIKGQAVARSCEPGEKALFALERQGETAVRIGCRQGGCGACRVRVVSGHYTTGKMSKAHVTEKEAAQGYVLCCRLYPESDLVIEPAFVGPHRRAVADRDT